MKQPIQLSVNEQEYLIYSLEELSSILDEAFANEFNEIWLSGYGSSSLSLLTNQTYAFVLFLEEEGEQSYTSRSASTELKRFENFLLSNGQMDQYPRNWLISKEEGKAVLIEYANSGSRSERISWGKA